MKQLCAKKMMNLIVECIGLENEEEVSDGKNVGDDTGFFDGLTSGIYPGEKKKIMKILSLFSFK